MGGWITQEQRVRRINLILSFIFLFRFVTARDLSLLCSTILGINMRRIAEYLLKNGFIGSFEIYDPVRTTGYYLLKEGLARLPKSLLEYDYYFFPARYKSSMFWHGEGVIRAFLIFQKTAPKGYWMSEWMVRQDKVKIVGKKAMGGRLRWRKKGVLGGRLPDGMFVVGKKARIAIEYEKTLKNTNNWERMIRDLEYGLKEREKIDLVTKDIVKGRNFEAVLFVFNEQQTFITYLKKFDKYSRTGKEEMLELGSLNETISLKRYFLSTLEELKKGHVFRINGEKINLSEVFNFVETVAANN